MPNPWMLKQVHSPVWEDLQSVWQHLEMTSQDNLLFFFLSHVDLRVESVLRMVLDTVKSSEAMWDWGNFCSQCLFRNRIKQEMFVWGFWKVCHNFVSGDLKTSLRIKCLLITERKKNENQRGRMTCPGSQPVCGKTQYPNSQAQPSLYIGEFRF